jgi:sortase A
MSRQGRDIIRWLSKLEQLLLIFGLLMLSVYVGARFHGVVLSQAAIQDFEKRRASAQEEGKGTGLVTKASLVAKTPDFSLWSETRIKDYRESLTARLSPAIALLRIPKIHLEVPVLEGTDDVSLNRGVGLIAGTALPGEDGNVGIAGHRDGFFRGLKDVVVGDTIELATLEETNTYVIDRIVIVGPEDVSVLGFRSRSSVTLVTCYPFYFLGSAPQRYIVQASLANADAKNLHAGKNADSGQEKISKQEDKN